MESLWIAVAVLICTLVGTLVGSVLRGRLEESHLGGDSKDVIKQCIGLIATMVALVLGLLVASAKSAFDAHNTGFRALSTNVIVLDRSLARYGPDAEPARELLRKTLASMIDHLWPPHASVPATSLDDRGLTAEAGLLYNAIRDLSPKDDGRREIRSQALQISSDLAKTRWSLGLPPSPLLPRPFLVVLLAWLTVLFGGFGLLTPRNGTVMTILFIGALSMAGALFLIVDMGEPFEGLIQVSGDSLRYALSQLGLP